MRRLLIALPALALLAGCGLFYAEIEIPATTVHVGTQDFAGGAPLVKEIAIDIGQSIPLLDNKDFTFDLRLTTVTVALVLPGSTMTDFGDIKDVTVTVKPAPGSTLPTTVVATYTQSPADPNPTSITVEGLNSTNLGPYVAGGTLTLVVQAESVSGGAIPDWKDTVDGVFYLKARADYGNMINGKL
jgi:hypothetical protein